MVSGRIVRRRVHATSRAGWRGCVGEREKPKKSPRKYIIHVSCTLLFVYDGETCACKSENEPGSPVRGGGGGRRRARSTCAGNVVFRRSVTRSLAVRADRYVNGLRTQSYRRRDDGAERVRGCRVYVVRCYYYYFFWFTRDHLARLHYVSPRETVFSCIPLTRFSASASLRLCLFG